MSPVTAQSVVRLEAAFDGGHLGYGVVAVTDGLAATVAAQLGAPALWRAYRPQHGDDVVLLWVWWPIETQYGAYHWESALAHADLILERIGELVELGAISVPLDQRPEAVADAIRADVYQTSPVFGVGSPGILSD